MANNIKIVGNNFSNVSIASGNFAVALNVTPQSGYQAIGVVGWSTQNRDVTDVIFISSIVLNISAQTITFNGKNTLPSAYTLNPQFAVLYIKE